MKGKVDGLTKTVHEDGKTVVNVTVNPSGQEDEGGVVFPLLALAATAGLGFLLGLLAQRRTKGQTLPPMVPRQAPLVKSLGSSIPVHPVQTGEVGYVN